MSKKTVKLTLGEPKKIPVHFEAKYPALFGHVGNNSDIPILLFVCEVLGIIDQDKAPVFNAQIYTDLDMFGGRTQRWSIRTRHIVLERSIEKEITDSWQSLRVLEDSLSMSGMPEDKYLDWNGGFGYDDFMGVGNITEEQAQAVMALARKLFKKPEIEEGDAGSKEKIRSDLKRQYKLLDSKTALDDPGSMDTYGELLCDPDEETAKGALENLKPVLKNSEASQRVLPYLALAMEKANRYVRHDLVQAVGLSFNFGLRSIILMGLEAPDGFVQAEACNWAHLFYGEDVALLLLENARSNEENIRWMAVAALGKVIDGKLVGLEDEQKIIQALLHSLKDENRYVRSTAAFTLSEQKNPDFLDDFIRLLKDPVDDIRARAVDALGKLKNPKALVPLKELLGQEGNQAILNALRKALVEITG